MTYFFARFLMNRQLAMIIATQPPSRGMTGSFIHSLWKNTIYLESVYKLRFLKKSSFSRRRESSVFSAFWIPRSSRRMTNSEFINRLYLEILQPSALQIFSSKVLQSFRASELRFFSASELA